MKRSILQVIPLLFLAFVCLSGFLLVRDVLQLPFRPTNDMLHLKEAPFNLDFLIPASTYLDDKITIGEVIKIRFKRVTPFYERTLQPFADLIPVRFRYLADLLLFFFWSFLFMTFFRVFSFMGYGRALRGSLLLGGCTYYFMPDFSPGRADDILLLGFPVFIIFLRMCILRKVKKRNMSRA